MFFKYTEVCVTMAWDTDKASGDIIASQDWDDLVSVIKKNAAVFNTSSSISLADTEYVTMGRLELPAGTTIKVHASAVNPSGVTGLNAVVRNVTDSTDIYSNNTGTNIGPDLASGGDGDTIELRLDNSSGSQQDAKAWIAVEYGSV